MPLFHVGFPWLELGESLHSIPNWMFWPTSRWTDLGRQALDFGRKEQNGSICNGWEWWFHVMKAASNLSWRGNSPQLAAAPIWLLGYAVLSNGHILPGESAFHVSHMELLKHRRRTITSVHDDHWIERLVKRWSDKGRGNASAIVKPVCAETRFDLWCLSYMNIVARVLDIFESKIWSINSQISILWNAHGSKVDGNICAET